MFNTIKQISLKTWRWFGDQADWLATWIGSWFVQPKALPSIPLTPKDTRDLAVQFYIYFSDTESSKSFETLYHSDPRLNQINLMFSWFPPPLAVVIKATKEQAALLLQYLPEGACFSAKFKSGDVIEKHPLMDRYWETWGQPHRHLCW